MSDRKPQGPRCSGRTANRRPCRQAPIPGTTRCWHHSYTVPGRPTKLTADVLEAILDALSDFAYLEQAAQAAGVHPRTLHRWRQRGEEAEANALEQIPDLDDFDWSEVYNLTDPADWVYIDFCHAIKSVTANAEIELLRLVARGGPQAWTAYMTILERRAPSRWGKRVEVKHDGTLDVGKAVDHELPDETDRERLRRLLLNAVPTLSADQNSEDT